MAKRNDPARKPPSMKRSQGQLANAYAPGAFFTFEGGRGACMSRVNPSAPGHEMILQREHQQQVIARLNEAADASEMEAEDVKDEFMNEDIGELGFPTPIRFFPQHFETHILPHTPNRHQGV